MKKYLMTSCLLCLTMAAIADNVQTVDAAKVSSVSFSGDNVVITYKDGTTATQDMNDVVIDMSNTTTAIKEVQHEQLSADDAVYDLQGRKVRVNGSVNKGVYIVKGKKLIINN